MARDKEGVNRPTIIVTIVVSMVAAVLGVVTERLFSNAMLGAVAGGVVGGVIAVATQKKQPRKADGGSPPEARAEGRQ